MTFNHAATVPEPTSSSQLLATSREDRPEGDARLREGLPSEGLPSGGLPSKGLPSWVVPSGGLSPSGDLTLRAVASQRDGRTGSAFLLRRVHDEMRHVADPEEGRYLAGVLSALVPCSGEYAEASGPELAGATLPDALVIWAGYLERRERLSGASRVLAAAADLRPDDAELALHAARVARKDSDVDRARSLYRAVGIADANEGHLSRMAEVGLALLHDDPRAALARTLRKAVLAGDREAAAVAHEERAAVRRRAGDRLGALRDYGSACVRFRDPADRGRVAHAAADLLVVAGDPLAAREVLLEVERLALPGQAERARVRLREISRAIGDQIGLRRWRRSTPPGLVSLSSSVRVSETRSLRSVVRRGIERLADPPAVLSTGSDGTNAP